MQSKVPGELNNIRIITVSARIGCGATTLANNLGNKFDWKVLHGGQLFRDFSKDHGYADKRPDSIDLEYDGKFKSIIREESHQIIESHLAGFLAQGISGVFKILMLCEDTNGNDKTEIRIDRLVNRDGTSIEQAKYEVKEREKQHLEKFRRLYMPNDPNWVYWDKKYYDLILNTYANNADKTVTLALEAIHSFNNPIIK